MTACPKYTPDTINYYPIGKTRRSTTTHFGFFWQVLFLVNARVCLGYDLLSVRLNCNEMILQGKLNAILETYGVLKSKLQFKKNKL